MAPFLDERRACCSRAQGRARFFPLTVARSEWSRALVRQAAGVAASHGFIGVRQLLHHTERLGFTTDGSAEVPSLCHGIMRAASNTQWRCIERCQRATALRSTVGRRLAGDHLMLQDMPFGSCPLARMPCLHTHRSMCLSCVRCAHTLKKYGLCDASVSLSKQSSFMCDGLFYAVAGAGLCRTRLKTLAPE